MISLKLINITCVHINFYVSGCSRLMTMDSVQTALVSTARFSLLLLLLQCLGNVQTIEAVNNNSTCALCIQPGEVSLRSLYIAFFTSFGGDFLSSGVIPAVDLALELINENTSILQGYSLNYTRIYRIQVSLSMHMYRSHALKY